MASQWHRINVGDTEYVVPRLAVCYAIYGDGRLVYVGSTEDLRARINQHGISYARYSSAIVTPWGRFLDIVVKYHPSRRYGDWLMREARLIRRLQPAGNRKGIDKSLRKARHGT